MNSLQLDFAVTPLATAPRLERFCRNLARAVRAGAFAVQNEDCRSAQADTVAVTASRVELTVPLANDFCVSLDVLHQLFETPDGWPDVGESVLVRAQGPRHDGLAALERRLAHRRTVGGYELPDPWPLAEPCTLAIGFAQPLAAATQAEWRADLQALEDVVAEAPFLGCEPGRYSAIGESDVQWLGPAQANYWTAGVASVVSWPALLCAQLSARTGPAPALTVSLLT